MSMNDYMLLNNVLLYESSTPIIIICPRLINIINIYLRQLLYFVTFMGPYNTRVKIITGHLQIFVTREHCNAKNVD